MGHGEFSVGRGGRAGAVQYALDRRGLVGRTDQQHPHGGHAIPIAERQILTLRERNADVDAKLRELVKERFPKLAHEIPAMLRTGDHLVGERAPSSGKSDSERFTFAEAPVADGLLDRAFRRVRGL